MRTVLVLAAALAAGGAQAEPVGVRTAEKMLFSTRNVQTLVRADAGLSEVDVKTLQIMFKDNRFPYYGAVAISPGDGLVSEATNLAQNLHSPQAAAEAALKACNAVRKAETPCVIAADVVPKGWKPQPLMLNQDATAGIRTYKQGKGPKAMAISPATGAWSIAKGPGADTAALNDCLNKAQPMGSRDCAIVIADD
jgi:hypothetical protein